MRTLRMTLGTRMTIQVMPGPSNRDRDDGQQTGVAPIAPKTIEEELEHWDENAEDDAWDEDDDPSNAGTKITPASSSIDDDDAPKKVAVD